MGMGCRRNNINNAPAGTSLNDDTYNRDRTWSDGIANSNSDFDEPKTNAFNGVRGNKLRTGGNSVLVTINFNPALTVNDYIEIHGEDYSSADFRYTVTINGMTHTKDVDSGGICRFHMGGSLTQITVDNNGGSGRTYLEYIKVDGRELVDDDITPPNATTLSAEVRANPAAGISIIKASGVSATDQINRVAHGLGKEPEFIFSKNLENTDNWFTFHKDAVNNNSGLKQTYRPYLKFDDNQSGTGTSGATNYVWEHTNATLGFNGALWVPSNASDVIMFYALSEVFLQWIQ